MPVIFELILDKHKLMESLSKIDNWYFAACPYVTV